MIKLLKFLFRLIIVIVFISIIIMNIDDDLLISWLTQVEYGVTRLELIGLNDDARTSIVSEYLRELNDTKTILFGATLSDIEIMNYFDNNLHNSYLRLHAFYGIGGIVLYILALGKSLMNYFYTNRIYFVLLITILLRISTDSYSFPGILDPLIIYFILIGINGNEYKYKIKSKGR